MFGAVYQCYLCIFLIAETDVIAARIIFYKMQADSSMNRGLAWVRATYWHLRRDFTLRWWRNSIWHFNSAASCNFILACTGRHAISYSHAQGVMQFHTFFTLFFSPFFSLFFSLLHTILEKTARSQSIIRIYSIYVCSIIISIPAAILGRSSLQNIDFSQTW